MGKKGGFRTLSEKTKQQKHHPARPFQWVCQANHGTRESSKPGTLVSAYLGT